MSNVEVQKLEPAVARGAYKNGRAAKRSVTLAVGKKVVKTKPKAAPKPAAKRATSRGEKRGSPIRRLDPALKITVLVKDNPRQEGSALYKQFEIARKSATVADYHAKGGRTGPLTHSVNRGWVKLS